VIRWDDHGAFRWAKIDSLSGFSRAYLGYAASGPNGVRLFAGETPASYPAPSDAIVLAERDQVIPFCFGDGSSGHCPCGNDARPGQGRGCVNSAGNAARLRALGDSSIGNDSLVLTSSDEVSNALSVFLQGDAQTNARAYGDGLLCTGGNLLRLFSKNAAAGTVSAPESADPSISVRSSMLGHPIGIGSTRYYQVYYRDSSATFCPPPAGSTWNVSSALSVLWVQ
jgi:hypothetical protein